MRRALRACAYAGVRLGVAAAVVCLAATIADAAPRTEILPYVEVDQILDTRLSGDSFGPDTVTYTSLAAGVDATVRTRRVEAGVSFRYEHQFAETHAAGDTNRYDGLARLNLHIVPGLLDFEAGGIATRTRYDIRGAAPAPNVGNPRNITQVYSGYLGPSLAHRFGEFDVTAAYRFGYTKVDDKADRGLAPGETGFGSYDHSTNQSATASIGMRPGDLPFGWTISGAWSSEHVAQLDGRFHDRLIRLDLTLPVAPTLALIGGVGYEDLKSSEDTPLIGPGGVPVLSANGRYIADPGQPRLLAYDSSGLYYDVGIVWKPSRRTTLIATVGKRYGGFSATGSFNHEINDSSSIQIGVYDVVDSFGRSLDRTLVGLPTAFSVPRNPFTNAIGGCVFSTDAAAGPGGCFDNSLQSVRGEDYRSRGVYALYSAGRGPVRIGIGGGYAQHRYLVPTGFAAQGRTRDQSYDGQANVSVRLSPRTTWENVVEVDYYVPGGPEATNVLTGSATSALYHSFTGHLSGSAAAGVYAYDQDGFDTDVTGQLLLGMRYQF